MVNIDPFFFDITTDYGLYIFLLLIGLAVLQFFKKWFVPCALMLFYVGFLLLYNNITNWFISMIPMFLAFLLLFGRGKS